MASRSGTPHINDVAKRIRYNGAYFEVDVVVNRKRGVVPVTWKLLRAHTPLSGSAYYARVYAARGWVSGRQAPNLGPAVILPEAFTPELTPAIFAYFAPAFIAWNRAFDGWTQGMAEVWMKTAVIHVSRAWTPEFVAGSAIASARAARITGRMALGATAAPGAASAARACSGGRCPCFVAGTPVATADGPIAIERVAVGQRVLPASSACAQLGAEGAALVKYRLRLQGTDGDVFTIELLRPRRWPDGRGARTGELVPVELDEMNVRGLALVTARDPRPEIDDDPARGCLVTGMVTHIATRLSVLRLVGEEEPIIATPWHRMYSHTRGDWVAIEDLAGGELLRTADGTVAVDSVSERGGQREPVFNLEVAGSHRYFVHARRVLTHNTYAAIVKPSSRALGRALEKAGHSRPPGAAAHHIVAGKKLEAGPARDILRRFGIGINDAPNGVFLPANKYSPNPTGAAVHSKLHTKAYYEAVNAKLREATTREQALGILAGIRRRLAKGTFP